MSLVMSPLCADPSGSVNAKQKAHGRLSRYEMAGSAGGPPEADSGLGAVPGVALEARARGEGFCPTEVQASWLTRLFVVNPEKFLLHAGVFLLTSFHLHGCCVIRGWGCFPGTIIL